MDGSRDRVWPKYGDSQTTGPPDKLVHQTLRAFCAGYAGGKRQRL